jgi:hypothetical protein
MMTRTIPLQHVATPTISALNLPDSFWDPILQLAQER